MITYIWSENDKLCGEMRIGKNNQPQCRRLSVPFLFFVIDQQPVLSRRRVKVQPYFFSGRHVKRGNNKTAHRENSVADFAIIGNGC